MWAEAGSSGAPRRTSRHRGKALAVWVLGWGRWICRALSGVALRINRTGTQDPPLGTWTAPIGSVEGVQSRTGGIHTGCTVALQSRSRLCEPGPLEARHCPARTTRDTGTLMTTAELSGLLYPEGQGDKGASSVGGHLSCGRGRGDLVAHKAIVLQEQQRWCTTEAMASAQPQATRRAATNEQKKGTHSRGGRRATATWNPEPTAETDPTIYKPIPAAGKGRGLRHLTFMPVSSITHLERKGGRERERQTRE